MSFDDFVKSNFCSIDDLTTKKILADKTQYSKCPCDKKMVMCVGADGAGKSTLIANLYANNVIDMPFVSAEFVEKKLVGSAGQMQQQLSSNVSARLAEKLLGQNASFCYEAQSNCPNCVALAKSAKQRGYKIVVFYVMTNSSDINIGRAEKQDVPAKKLSAEHLKKSEQNVKQQVIGLISVCDHLYMFDNSKELSQTNISEIQK